MEKKTIEFALSYAELGYPVFPIRALGKAPATRNGLLDATTDLDIVREWFSSSSNYNIGMRTDGLLVLDVDGSENPWLSAEETRLSGLLATPHQRTPSGGLHFFFRQPAGAAWRNTAGKIAANVDTRGTGGYVIVAPSELYGGRSYCWETELNLEPDDLPEPPEWLIAILDAITGPSAKSVRATLESSDPIPDGQRNSTLLSIGGALRRIGLDETAIGGALKEVNRSRCHPPLSEREVLSISTSAARYEPDQIAQIVAEGTADRDDDDDEQDHDHADEFPSRLLEVPGFVGEFARWIDAHSYRLQPVLSLAASITLLGMLAGRRIVDEFDVHPNLYTLGIVDTGRGKDSARRAIKALLEAACADELLGNESWGSHAGLIIAVESQPRTLFLVDELGRYLETTRFAQVSHKYEIPSVLMKLYTSTGSTFVGAAYADRTKTVKIRWPHVCIYGTTVPGAFYAALDRRSIGDGLINRLIVFEGARHARPSKPTKPPIPQELIEATQEWYGLSCGSKNGTAILAEMFPSPRKIPSSDGARHLLDEFSNETFEEESRPGSFDALWVRAHEISRKLSLICAASRGGPTVERIEEDDAAWGVDLARHLTKSMIARCAVHITDGSQREQNLVKIQTIIEEAKEDGVTLSAILRKCRGVRKWERDEILDDLIVSRRITRATVIRSGRGRPAIRYYPYRCAPSRDDVVIESSNGVSVNEGAIQQTRT